MLLLLLMNGALVNLREVARPLQVGQSLSFFRYGFEALLTNELEDTIVMVDAPGIMPIPVKSRVFLAILGMDADNIPNDKSVLALFCVGHAALALLLLYVKASTWRPKFLCRPPVPRKRTPGEQVLTEVAVVNSKKGHSTALL
ncbi:hypothetical protein T492DRAFT_845373 [Pavlovales sp. CCMP2436]|nr:hypothetical protein T492DRAFT_845373 [Pavlovales sp. CCMP2436]